jgi:excisionase family DNA binding protein
MASARAVSLESSPQPASPEVGRPLVLPRLLTLAEVADMLQVSQKTVQRLVARRRLPCIRLGRVVRFSPADLLRFVEARKE